VIPKNITTIEKYAFASTYISSVLILGPVETIGDYGFGSNRGGRCPIDWVVLPDTLTYVGKEAFSYVTSYYTYYGEDEWRDIDVYFCGSEIEWQMIEFDGSTSSFLNQGIFSHHCVTMHYDYVPDTDPPAVTLSATNEIASTEQTVTVKVTDASDIKGYYLGNNRDYKANTFFESGDTALEFTASAPGTYYLTFMDIMSNLSETKSVTFYQTTFDCVGGTTFFTSQLTPAGSSIDLPEVVKADAEFLGWSSVPGAEKPEWLAGQAYSPEANLTLYAVYKGPEIYTLTFDANGGAEAPAPIEIEEDLIFPLPSKIPSRSYRLTYIANGGTMTEKEKTVSAKFIEWNDAADGSGTSYAAGGGCRLRSDLVLYAQWTLPKAGALSVPTRDGHAFDGWYTAVEGGNKVTEETVIDQSATLYAHWKKLSEYTVSYNANGGSGAPSNQTKTYGNPLTLSADRPALSFTLTYNLNGGTLDSSEKTYEAKFIDWNTASDGSGTAYLPGAVYSDNRNATLYAQWTLPCAGDLPQPTRSGYSFVGWYTEADDGEPFTEDNVISGDRTVFARWSKLASYRVTYDANGGTGAPAAQTKLAGVSLTLSNKKPTKTYQLHFNANGGTLTFDTVTVNATFRNWNTKADGSGSGYTSGGTYSINADVTFYARWTNPTAGELPTPSRDGYTFDGWYTAAKGGDKVISSTTVTKAQTLYAHWTTAPKPYRYLEPSDIFSFSNSPTYFGSSYYVSDADFLKLVSYVREMYRNNPYAANTTINNLQAMRAESWGGSCYGMAVVTILDKLDTLRFNETFDSGAATMSQVTPPSRSNIVKSAINYYYLSQAIPYVSNYKNKLYKNLYSDWKTGLKQLVAMAQEGQPILFGYFFEDEEGSHGHAIVIKGYEKAADGTHHIIAYDNRYPDLDEIIAVDAGFTTCVINGVENAYTIDYTQDMSAFDLIDIRGTTKTSEGTYASAKTGELMMAAQESLNTGFSTSEITVPAKGRLRIENGENETLILENGRISDESTMDVANERMRVASTESGKDCSSLTFTVADSDLYTFESDEAEMNVSVQNAAIFGSAKTNGARYITISKNDGVFVLGDDFTYDLSLSVNSEMCDMVTISGKADNDVKLTYKGKKVTATGVDAKNGVVTVHSNLVDTDRYTYTAGYDSFVISAAKSGAAGDVEILGSSGSNGLYNVSIGKALPTTDEPAFGKGDVNNDGKVGSDDARLALRTSVKLEKEIVEGTAAYNAADYNGDGVVKSEDARAILRVSVKLDPFG
jgi:uncharacterized repeat protein (TIGR02543 family)